MIVDVMRKSDCQDIPLPEYQTTGAAGMDLHAAVKISVTLMPGQFMLIPTGLHIAVPLGYEAQVRARSGLAFKKGIGVLNGPGTIDSDYRGEVGVILFNFGKDPFVIHRGDRIAQMVFAKFQQVTLKETRNLNESTRNANGFGSTGHK